MGPTLYDKSPKYGDINKGFAVSAQIASMCTDIDERNPAVVKYARIILGTDEATRDSIDDIVSYASKSNGTLSAVQDKDLPPVTRVVLEFVQNYAENYGNSPVVLAYVSAIFAAIGRGSKQMAFELVLEFSEYLDSNHNVNTGRMLVGVVRYAAQLIRVLAATPTGDKNDN